MDTDSTLQELNRVYSKCVSKHINEAWKSETPQRVETEICLKEKNDFYGYMKKNFKTEYQNLMRVFDDHID